MIGRGRREAQQRGKLKKKTTEKKKKNLAEGEDKPEFKVDQ